MSYGSKYTRLSNEFPGLYEKGRSEHNLGGDVPWRWGYRETHESLVNVNDVSIQTVHEASLKS